VSTLRPLKPFIDDAMAAAFSFRRAALSIRRGRWISHD
jgi:hypothetical protein